MAVLSYFAEAPREENPYAAPQTRELVLPVALERVELQATRREEVLPRSTQRWLNAALTVYGLAFVVPIFESGENWTPFVGFYFFFVGAVMCWHPMLIAWWANVFFLLSRRNLHRGRSERACVYAGIGVLVAATFLVFGVIESQFIRMNPPYFCWLTAMILQWIAAVDMRQFNRDRVGEMLVDEAE